MGAVELMNTVWADHDTVHDALASRSEAARWIRKELPGAARFLNRDWENLVSLRDALRRLAADVTGDPWTRAKPPAMSVAAAARRVNEAAARAPRFAHLVWDSEHPTSHVASHASAAALAVATIADDGIRLFAGPDREQLRACLAPGCVLYFVKDHPRREWCSAGCGNRARVARHYRRHR